ncbi:E3 ubiquitin-protein ligase RNF43-like [Pseudophryne corroboree]|uniref:E3 ubiquitin-protein ligase RNF43-like n=1 Tax=Pseudophryne corroboree TaxID=495146 RepID=UPI003081D552
MSRRELRRLLEDQRTWSRQGDHDESSQTVFEERLRSERRRGVRRTRQNTREHPSSGETSPRLQRPRREHRHRSRSPLPTPPVATTDRPSPDPRPGPSSQQPAENEQNLPAMVIEIDGQNLSAMMIEIDEQNLLAMMIEIDEQNLLPMMIEIDEQNLLAMMIEIDQQNLLPMMIEIDEQNLLAMMIEIDQQNLLAMVEEIYGFQMTTVAEDEAAQSCAICLMEYEEGERVIVLSCSHRYHPSCILQWFATNLSCPLCRRECILRPAVCLIR